MFLSARPIDLRKSFDGWCAGVEVVFARSVFDRHLFLAASHDALPDVPAALRELLIEKRQAHAER